MRNDRADASGVVDVLVAVALAQVRLLAQALRDVAYQVEDHEQRRDEPEAGHGREPETHGEAAYVEGMADVTVRTGFRHVLVTVEMPACPDPTRDPEQHEREEVDDAVRGGTGEDDRRDAERRRTVDPPARQVDERLLAPRAS